MTNFEKKVLDLVKEIPLGKITTYQVLALKLGKKTFCRSVGNALNKNKNLLKIPCHRVVRSDRKAGNYRLGLAKKIKLLQNEGVSIKGGKIVNFESCFYNF